METKIDKYASRRGENHFAWKGSKAAYRSIHTWVENNYGLPDSCEHCPKAGLSGRQIHWANISGKYKRDRGDWKRLCLSCHRKMDKWREKIQPSLTKLAFWKKRDRDSQGKFV